MAPNPIIPLLPLRVCSGPSAWATTSGVDAVALEGQQAVVEGLEVLARVLEVDGEQLGGDLEVERHESRLLGSPMRWLP